VEDLYSPPINIRVKDNRAFGRKPLVGIHSVKQLAPFKCKLPSQKTAEDETEVDGKLIHLLYSYLSQLCSFCKETQILLLLLLSLLAAAAVNLKEHSHGSLSYIGHEQSYL